VLLSLSFFLDVVIDLFGSIFLVLMQQLNFANLGHFTFHMGLVFVASLINILGVPLFRMDEMMRGHRGWRELNTLNGDKFSKINNFIGGLMSPRSSESKAVAVTKEIEDDEWTFEQV
jgi:hypothetical protein